MEEDGYSRQVKDAFPEIEDISDQDLRAKTITAWTLALERGGWRDIYDIPYAWNIPNVSNVEHVRGTLRIAVETASIQRDFHSADPDLDTIRSAVLLHDVGKCYEYVDYVDDDKLGDERDPEYANGVIPHSLSGYAIAHEVGCPLSVQRAIPHYKGEISDRTLEAELVKSANSASSNAIIQSEMGISLDEWIDEYSTA